MCRISVSSILLAVFLQCEIVNLVMAQSGGDLDGSSVPLLPSGKRQHNIMRFGKRGGHALMHFGKREYLVENEKKDDMSSRPGHAIMHFGKRAYPLEYALDDDLYKRGGHALMHFGKREYPLDDSSIKRGHAIMHFGKRDYPIDYPLDDDLDKRGGHALMHFGKRAADSHNFIRFGRGGAEDLDYPDYEFSPEYFYEDRRSGGGHAMLSFGKRDPASHAMIHFGKRLDTDEEDPTEDEEYDKRTSHQLLRFGKKGEGAQRSHAMIHFGKRAVPSRKKSHSMIHFGKRDSLEEQPLNRSERSIADDVAEDEDEQASKNLLLHFG